ncbi:transposase IS4 family protein [Caldalkalibacillus thermarum TA2.A1]|uniref:Transposase n=1 Tax=Caldalkalibacillus thermarum (strain TA2.A1) TaxID=986075 RepID=F5L8H0_CALTT|nr:transposase [Caldalkalibacillus thermarum]EGL82403.1 transposase IS4 family protein [Caldalkalibacillus thermarum TA2.A1]QZT34279.1 transposase [Caldalkalibacillus thermarum TA2.A1]GGK28572.1 hypothetical protein GCM10010965_21720 [Caldalkalibacillus thermarum]
MAIIPQLTLFAWEDIEELGDLERLSLVMETMPDEALMQTLEAERGRGRNDYPIRAMWNSVLAGIVFQHESIEKLRRELARNGQLRHLCGFQGQVPPAWAYTRFFQKLLHHADLIQDMFNQLVQELRQLLPDFGKHLAMDSKAIASYARHKNKNGARDGRRDTEATYGVKTYRGQNEDGTTWEKVVRWFGYKLHLIVDAVYELPIHYSLTQAHEADITEAHRMIDHLEESHPEMLENAETLAADKAYDDTKLIRRLWDDHQIKPVIDIRNSWKDGEQTRLLDPWENVVYTYRGQVCCVCPETGTERQMAHGGFEKDRNTLKKRCPAKQYGIQCQGMSQCPVAQGIRIPLSKDRRIFTPIDRSSYAWEKAYRRRTAAERVNSRLDGSFGLEKHTIRGEQKMRVRCGLALCVMLAIAVGRIKANQAEKMRSLVA